MWWAVSAKGVPGLATAAIQQGSRGYLRAMEDPVLVRIMLLDGPAELGQIELDKIDRETSADASRFGLAEETQAKQIQTLPIEALTVQPSAVFDRAAMAISLGDEPKDHLQDLDSLLATLVGEYHRSSHSILSTE